MWLVLSHFFPVERRENHRCLVSLNTVSNNTAPLVSQTGTFLNTDIQNMCTYAPPSVNSDGVLSYCSVRKLFRVRIQRNFFLETWINLKDLYETNFILRVTDSDAVHTWTDLLKIILVKCCLKTCRGHEIFDVLVKYSDSNLKMDDNEERRCHEIVIKSPGNYLFPPKPKYFPFPASRKSRYSNKKYRSDSFSCFVNNWIRYINHPISPLCTEYVHLIIAACFCYSILFMESSSSESCCKT